MKITLTERPAFVKVINYSLYDDNEDYILQFDLENPTASIIKLKKGGNKDMVKTIVKAKKNFETLYESVKQMIDEFEEKKAKAIEEAIAQVEEDFKADKETLDTLFAQVSETEEVEVPDEEEVSEDAEESVEEQPVVDTLY